MALACRRRERSFVLTILLAATLAFQSGALPEGAGSEAQIIVYGQRLDDHERALAACLARSCPPDEDIDAALAYAEALFVDGGYERARSVVADALGRNRRHARAYPEPVADLYRSQGRIARHLGRDEEAVRAGWATLRTLQAGLPDEQHRHFSALLELSDIYVATGDRGRAFIRLAELRAQASRAGRSDVEAVALLRELWMQHSWAPHGTTRSRIARIAAGEEGDEPTLVDGARFLLARIARAEGDDAESARLLEGLEVASGGAGDRALLHCPPIPAGGGARGLATPDMDDVAAAGLGLVEVVGDWWMDVGFWVLPDGTVDEVEILRQSGRSGWSAPITRAIAGRLYAPAGDADYRIERYTYTASRERPTGSRIAVRMGDHRVEYLDLTGRPDAPPAPRRQPRSAE